MAKIKIGIVGTGGIARGHVKGYLDNPDAEITAVYDVLPVKMEQFLKNVNLPNVSVCKSLDELLQKVDAISICTPNNTHFQVAKAAIDAGKHFICEKPLTATYNEAVEFANYYKNQTSKVKAMMGFSYRDIPAVRFIKKFLDEGKMGRIYTITQQLGNIRIADPFKVKREWRMDIIQSGTGALIDFGCHLLDLTDHLITKESGRLCSVQASKNTFISQRMALDDSGQLPVTNDDAALFSGITEKGTLCSYYVNRLGMPFETLQITGEGGMLYWNSHDDKKVGMQLKEKTGGYTGPMEFKEVPQEFFGKERHTGLIAEFVNAVKTNVTPSRGIDQGLYVQYVLEKINEAAETGKVVKL